MSAQICDAERACIMERFEELKGTLNGRPAIILGRSNDFPVVRELTGNNASVEFSWHALKSRVASGKVHI